MSDDYLWDGSGEPDPQIQKLESALGRLRHNRPAPEFPEMATIARPVRRTRFLPLRLQWAVAAALAVVAVGLILLWPKPEMTRSNWDVTRVEGAPHLGGNGLTDSVPGTSVWGKCLKPTHRQKPV